MNVLTNWSVHNLSPYTPPEYGKCVAGVVVSHTKFPSGKSITTSKIVESDPVTRTITTISGSKYLLQGAPKREYLEWLGPGRDPFPAFQTS